MDRIFIVYGLSGHHEDRTQWPVASYSEQEHAEEHARRAKEAAKGWDDQDGDGRDSFLSPYDSDIQSRAVPYEAVRYFVGWVAYFSHLDQYVEERTRE